MSMGGRSSSGRVLVVEEHGLVAAGVQLALSERGWHVHTAGEIDREALVEKAQRFQPQCVLLDIHLSSGTHSGIALIEPLTATGSHVVMLTAETRRMVLAECLEAGAAGWIAKRATVDEVDSMLADVVAGRAIIGRTDRASMLDELQLDRAAAMRAKALFDGLTKREALVLRELLDGLSAEEIAEAHFVSMATVRSQIHSVLQKLGVRSQLAAVAAATPHRELLPCQEKPGHDRRRAGYAELAIAGPALRR